jgi:hypothetical protein
MTTPKQELKRAKAALKLAQKLNAANEATRQFIFACCDCGERYPYPDDSRMLLQKSMTEYSGWLESVYRKKLVDALLGIEADAQQTP